jgi:hypothetical protein
MCGFAERKRFQVRYEELAVDDMKKVYNYAKDIPMSMLCDTFINIIQLKTLCYLIVYFL